MMFPIRFQRRWNVRPQDRPRGVTEVATAFARSALRGANAFEDRAPDDPLATSMIYEIQIRIGPCSPEQAENAMSTAHDAILAQTDPLGAVASLTVVADEARYAATTEDARGPRCLG